MYNEDEVLFSKTTRMLGHNIAHLCGRTRSRTWGPEGWKKVVVCIVSDGRSKVDEQMLQIGYYQEGVAKDLVAGKDMTAHIFECTSNVVVTEIREVSTGNYPIQIIFCLKEQSKKKLNNHHRFFNAFGH
ncbi:chitin synthase [Suillus weaverae]|nr:chitin synthase [Suillus weaverae]